MAPIEIRGNVIDPTATGDHELPADAANTKYVLVQLSRDMDNGIASALELHSAEIIKRMNDDTWLLYYPPADLRVLETVDGVQHALVYVSDFVVKSSIPQPMAEDELLLRSASVNTAAASTEASEEPISVSVYLHETASEKVNRVLTKIQGIAGVEVTAVQDGIFHLEATPANLQLIAAFDSVQAIEEVPTAVPFSNRVRDLCGINSANLSLPPGASALTGDGQCVGMSDSGVDRNHDAFQDMTDKLAHISYLKGIEDDDTGHGTHVAATILGGPVSCWQKQPVIGLAPGASLGVIGGIYRGAQWVASSFYEEAYNLPDAKCRIFNCSWGKDLRGPKAVQPAYSTADAEGMDQWLLAHPDFLVVIAAGNDGEVSTPTGSQIGAWAVAKNALTVGATFTDRPFKTDRAVDYSGATTQRTTGTVAGFSSRGPVLGTQRTKPDIVAPGAGVLSARASHPEAVRKQSTWPTWYGTPPGGYEAGDKTIFCSGTSMATPVVSGCAALLREAMMKWHNISPSAPLMKALIINGTDDLKQDRNTQGYGQINMHKILAPVMQSLTDISTGAACSGYAQYSSAKRAADTHVFKATLTSSSSPEKKSALQITLVYHDYQGDTIQNRLYLSVERKGTKTETKTSQRLENVHRVLLEDVDAGDVVSIGIVCDFLNNETPWAVVWNQVEV